MTRPRERSKARRTPGVRFYVRRVDGWPRACWQVIPILREQAQSMEERGEKTFPASAQAYAVAKNLNKKEEEKSECKTK